jgi:nitroreductase
MMTTSTLSVTAGVEPKRIAGMDALTAIEQRRSVKHYDANFVMPEADAQALLQLAMLSPTSFNMQNWRFVWVQNTEKREALKSAAWGQAQVTDASMLLLLCADLNAATSNPERYWALAPQPVQDMIVPMLGQFYTDNPTLQRDEAMRSVGIAAQTLMVAAKAMGYDSCPMVGYDPTKVAEIINLPEDHVIGMMLTIGKAVQPAKARGGQLPFEEVVIVDTF